MTRGLQVARLTVASVVAVTVVATACAGGGYSDLAVGSATLIVWGILLAGALSGRIGGREVPGALVAASSLLLALLGLTVLSMSWTFSDESAFAEAVRLAGYLGVLLLVGLTARPRWIAPALAGVAVAGVVVALLSVGSRLLGIGSGDGALVAQLPSAGGRLSYPVGYWNALGALVVMALPALCWLATESRTGRARGLALAAFGPPLLAAYMTSSRGALIAAVVGLVVVVGFAADRRRAAAVALVGIASSVPAVITATFASGILDSPGDGSAGGTEIAVLSALLVGMAAALTVGPKLADRMARTRVFSIRIRVGTVLLVVASAAALLIVLAGPSALIGDIRSGTEGTEDERTIGIVSASGTGRTQFWSTALDAYASEPVHGVGAGGYETYWNRNGSLETPARNAHSEPLELLAELGPLGLLCFAGFVVIVLASGTAARRGGGVGETAAALGIVAAGLVGFLIDWTWHVPAVALPVLIAAGLLVGTARQQETTRLRISSPHPSALLLCVIVLAVPALWGAGVLTVASSRLDASSEAFDRGQLDEAAVAARSAAAIEPWAAEPWLRLAEIEQAGGNLRAAQSAAAEAIDREPESSRAWLFAAGVQLQRGNRDAGVAYGTRAVLLRPPR